MASARCRQKEAHREHAARAGTAQARHTLARGSAQQLIVASGEGSDTFSHGIPALYENRETLDPDTVTTIDTNLRVINRAIRRAREALDEDPQNGGLNRMLSSNYRRKLELLQRANRMIELS